MILGAALMAIGQAEVQTAFPHPVLIDNIWFRVGIVLLVVGSFVFGAGVVSALRRWKESALTPFRIVHDMDDVQCVQRDVDNDGSLREVQLRIKIQNSGRVGLQHVRARLIKDGGHDHWLRIRHDNNPPNYDRSQNGEVLPADDTYWVYFDVAYSQLRGDVIFEYADEYLRTISRSSDPQQLFTVVVWGCREDDGRSVEEGRARFRLEQVDNWNDVRLTKIPSG